MPAPTRSRAARPSHDDMATLRGLLEQAERPMVIVGGGGWSAAGLRRHPRLRRGQRPAGLRLVPQPGPVRQPPSQLCRRSRRRRQPGAGQAHQGVRPASSRSARGSARRRPAATRCSTCRCRSRRWCMSMPAPRSSAASTRRPCRSTRGMANFAAAAAGDEAGRRPGAGRQASTAAHAEYLDNIKPGPLPGAVEHGRGASPG